MVPVASNNPVSFESRGPGQDPWASETATRAATSPTLRSFELPEPGLFPISQPWRWHKVENPYPPALPEEAPAQFDDSTWSPVDVAPGEAGTLGFHDKAVYRARFNVTARPTSPRRGR